MRFRQAPMRCDDVRRVPIVQCLDNKNTCGTVASCDIGNGPHWLSARCSHRRVHGLPRCRWTRVARSRITASILP